MIRVLLIDDHAQYRAVLRRLLSQHDDIEVVAEAHHGAGALDLVASCSRVGDADAALLVLLEPRGMEMNGIETTRRTLAISPRAVVMALSSHDDPALVAVMKEIGCKGYALKSAPLPELVHGIRQVAAGREWFSPELQSG